MRFSVLTPTRDRLDWLPAAIASVERQGFTDFEHIVFDNGERSCEHLIPADTRWRYVRGEASGPADAFDQAIGLARGEILTLLADDDELPADALEVVNHEIGEFAWLVGRTRCTDEHGKSWLSGGPVDLAELERVYYLGGAVHWKRELTDRLGGMNTDFDGAADYDLYLRFARHTPAAFVDRVLYLYNDHPGTDSRVNPARQQEASERIKAA